MQNEHNPQLGDSATSPTVAIMRDILVRRFDVAAERLHFDAPLEALGLESLSFIEYLLPN